MAATASGVTVDVDALEELIIGVNRLKQITDNANTEISRIVTDMSERLTGGQAEALLEAFKSIGVAMGNLSESSDDWVKKLDMQLEKSYGIKNGTVGQMLAEATDKDAKNLGILRNAKK